MLNSCTHLGSEEQNRGLSRERSLCDHKADWEPWLPLLPVVTGGCRAVSCQPGRRLMLPSRVLLNAYSLHTVIKLKNQVRDHLFWILSIKTHQTHLHYNIPQVNSLQQNLNFLYFSNLSFSCSYKYKYHRTTTIAQSRSQGTLLGGVGQGTLGWGPWVFKGSTWHLVQFVFLNQSTVFSSKRNGLRTCKFISKEHYSRWWRSETQLNAASNHGVLKLFYS